MQSSMIKSITEDFGNGGTIDGDLTISGDLQVSGGGSLSFDEIIQGTQVIDVTNTEALLVRKNDDGGDVFVVDTTNSRVGIGITPAHNLTVNNQIGVKRDGVNAYGTLTFTGAGFEIDQSVSGYNPLIVKSYGTEVAKITSAGNVGIGRSTNIDKKLHILSSTSGDGITLEQSSTGSNTIKFEADSSALRGLFGSEDSDGGAILSGSSGYSMVLRSESDIFLATNGNNEALKIDTSQKATFAGDVTIRSSDTAGIVDSLTLINPRNSGSTGDGTQINFQNTDTVARSAFIKGMSTGTYGQSNVLVFGTSSGIDAPTEKMRIDSSGKVGIGTSSVNGIFTAQGTPMTAIGAQTVADIFGNVQQDADKGGGIGLGGRYITNSNSVTAFAEISGVKANNTSANYEGEMVFKTRVHGGNLTERMRIDGSGDSTFAGNVTVNGDTLSLVKSNNNAFLKIESTDGGEAIFEMRATTNRTNQIRFFEGATQRGSIVYAHASQSLAFNTGDSGTLALTLDSSQNATFAGSVTIASGGSTDNLYLANTSYGLKITNSTGVIDFMSNGSSRMSIANGGGVSFASDVTIGGSVTSNALLSNTSSTYDIGSSSNLWRNAYLKNGGRVYFGDTGTYVYGSSSLDVLSFAVGANERFKLDVNSRISLSNNDSGTSNTVFGKLAGNALASGGNYNVILGDNAGNDLTTGDENVLIGYLSGDNLTTESGNVFIGKNTGNTGQQLSILIGNDTGRLITSGNGTVGIGHNTLYALSTGQYNTVVGYDSMRAEVNGDRSTAFGYQTLRSQTGTDGIVGTTAIGYKAGYNATSGIHGIFIGADANPSSGSSNNEIVIGYGATGVADNSVTLGNSSVTDVYIAPGQTSEQSIVFRDSVDAGKIVYSHNNNQIQFRVGGTGGNSIKARIRTGGDLYLDGGQITFPASQVASSNANTLDDYEEGTWTGVITTTGTDFTTTSRGSDCKYTKIGDTVTAWFSVSIASPSNGTGTLKLTGLPFTSLSGNTSYRTGLIDWGRTDNVATLQVNGVLVSNATEIIFRSLQDASTSLDFPASNMNGQVTPFFTGRITYKTA